MTAWEALKDLKRFVQIKTTQRPAFLDVAIKALYKQIAERPEIGRESYGYDAPDSYFWKCPECGEKYYFDLNNEYNYCRECGQKIDWGVAEDEDDNI